jgi:hypothetical protein
VSGRLARERQLLHPLRVRRLRAPSITGTYCKSRPSRSRSSPDDCRPRHTVQLAAGSCLQPLAVTAGTVRLAREASAVLSGRGANPRRQSPAGASIARPMPPCRCCRTAARGRRFSCIACSNNFSTKSRRALDCFVAPARPNILQASERMNERRKLLLVFLDGLDKMS